VAKHVKMAGMAKREPEVPEEQRIRFRIGINLGDVIVEAHDIFGDGVNVAARLEGLAEPGGICVSRVVRDQVRDKVAFAFEDLGEQQVKNIARPVRVYRVRDLVSTSAAYRVRDLVSTSAASRSPPVLTLPDKPSVAVLPFVNMSSDPEQEFLADGIAVIRRWPSYPTGRTRTVRGGRS
jgi:adenylate cyclase